MVWRAEDQQGNEAAKVIWECIPYLRGPAVLDLGCGPEKALPHFIGVDSCKDTELFGIQMKPDLKVDDCSRISAYVEPESVDAIFSSHLLEHIEDYEAALRDWWSVLKPDGHLVLYLPHRELYPNIGTPGANPDHKHDFVPDDIIAAMDRIDEFAILENQIRRDGCEYSFLLVLKKCNAVGSSCYKVRVPCDVPTVCVVRYGGFGDMLQASSVLPGLKEAGYHVTVMTTPKGSEIIENDPNVDAFYWQDQDQVPNHRLNEFWAYVSQKFDRFINLCESVEGTLLAMPGRANHMWPSVVRHKYMNLNYLEFTADLAGLPGVSPHFFYPSEEEKAKVLSYLDTTKLNVVFALSGSSIHKFYPWQDEVIAATLNLFPDAEIYLVGDEACKILEFGLEDMPRVHCLSGEIGIRETLTLAKYSDVVIGCETGVLNAVAFEKDVRKICLLSHSSPENLTKHWINAKALTPQGVPCYPCHRLHQGREFCVEDKATGAAACQLSIPFQKVVEAIYEP